MGTTPSAPAAEREPLLADEKEVPAKEEEELSESKQLMQKVKDAGIAGIISYIFWEWAFWGGEYSVRACVPALSA